MKQIVIRSEEGSGWNPEEMADFIRPQLEHYRHITVTIEEVES